MSHLSFAVLVLLIVAPGLTLAVVEIRSLQKQVALLTAALKALTAHTETASNAPAAYAVDLTETKTATKTRKPRTIRGARRAARAMGLGPSASRRRSTPVGGRWPSAPRRSTRRRCAKPTRTGRSSRNSSRPRAAGCCRDT